MAMRKAKIFPAQYDFLLLILGANDGLLVV